MALKKKPVTGMKDMLPREMEIRDYLIGLIKETYKTYGFCSIETPCVEHIENLCSKQGGDNEKLIFKILKRGEKLKIDTAKEENDLVDGGLRYDLTVPLSRYYSNHANELPSPFKALQMGSVWRADRPQRGRFRQFTQCDIDILGDATNMAEIELILATTTYNAEIYPFMRTFIEHLTERNYQNRTIGLIENGSWAPNAAKVMQAKFEKSKNITWLDNTVKIMSSLSDENIEELDKMAEELCK